MVSDGSNSSQPRDVGVPHARAEADDISHGDDYALIVGIDHYRNCQHLRGAVSDAKRLRDWLTDPDGGAVPNDNVELVESDSDAARPIQKQIDEALARLVNAAAKGGGRLYFIFAGHGTGSELTDDVALLLAQWSLTTHGHALSKERYRAQLVGLRRFREVVVLLDCCRNICKLAVGLAPTFRLEALQRRTTYFVAHATVAGAFSFENSDANGQWQGTFTRHLLQILRSYRSLLANDLKKTLEGRLKEAGQRPEVVNGLETNSWFGPPTHHRPRLLVRFTKRRSKVEIQTYIPDDGDGAKQKLHTIDSCENPPDPWPVHLRPGLYKLVDEHQNEKVFDHPSRSAAPDTTLETATDVEF